MDKSLEKIREQENQKKIDKAKAELKKLADEWVKEGIVLSAQMTAMDNGFIAQPIIKIVEKNDK